LGLIAMLILLWLGAALIGAVLPGQRTDLPGGPAEVEIRLLSGPIHYDFLLPLDAETRARLGLLAHGELPLDHTDAAWLMIGWGARAFYTTTGRYSDLSAKAVLRGVFGDRSVMRVDVLPELGSEGPWTRLFLSRVEYDALLGAILASFEQDPEGRAQTLDHPGFNATDKFFEARGTFDILRTCNVWVGDMLRAAGQDFGAWTPTPFSIRAALWLHSTGTN
jgi:uncharacterized protein (TIGR02117 family)